MNKPIEESNLNAQLILSAREFQTRTSMIAKEMSTD